MGEERMVNHTFVGGGLLKPARKGAGLISLDLTRAIKDFCGKFVVSPLFFLLLTGIFLLVPERVLKGNVKENLISLCRQMLKMAMDIVISFLCIVALSPLYLIIALIIKIDSRGPVLYKQVRIGQNRRNHNLNHLNCGWLFTRGEKYNRDRRGSNHLGRPFTMYKFRTMKENAEEETGPVWAAKDDPRITRVGKILRVTRLDETPQFFNVLKGEMSLVGPRPERPHFVSQLEKEIPGYSKRFEIKPGITGLAQVRYKYGSSLSETRKKVRYDLFYLKTRSLLLDLRILLATVKIVLFGKGAH